jgi:hypothetical protein
MPSDSVGVNANALETINPGAQLVVSRPGQAAELQKGYEIKLKGNTVDLRPVNEVDPNFQDPGNLIGATKLTVPNPNGSSLEFTVSMKQGGLEITPSNVEASKFAEENRATVIGGGVLGIKKDLGVEPDKIRTIFLDLKQ